MLQIIINSLEILARPPEVEIVTTPNQPQPTQATHPAHPLKNYILAIYQLLLTRF